MFNVGKLYRFIGPGFMIAVGYLDPGVCYSSLIPRQLVYRYYPIENN
jgi:Mn2+/Fe2+ NRAMP family transporter